MQYMQAARSVKTEANYEVSYFVFGEVESALFHVLHVQSMLRLLSSPRSLLRHMYPDNRKCKGL